MGSSTSTSRSSGGGMGPAQSMAMAGNTGLASATEKQAQTIRRTTGKSFKAIGQQIGEVGSKYRRPADVEKYAKELSVMEAGDVLGAKKFTAPDGIERVSFVGTGMKDEQGRTILSKQIPQLTAQAPTLRQLGGDIARGAMGYKTIEYVDDKPTMVQKKGLIPSVLEAAISGKFSPIAQAINVGSNFFSYGDGGSKETTTTTTEATQPSTEFAESEAKRKARLAQIQGAAMTDASRKFIQASKRTFGGGK